MSDALQCLPSMKQYLEGFTEEDQMLIPMRFSFGEWQTIIAALEATLSQPGMAGWKAEVRDNALREAQSVLRNNGHTKAALLVKAIRPIKSASPMAVERAQFDLGATVSPETEAALKLIDDNIRHAKANGNVLVGAVERNEVVGEALKAAETERLRLINWGKEMIRKGQGKDREIALLKGEPWPPVRALSTVPVAARDGEGNSP